MQLYPPKSPGTEERKAVQCARVRDAFRRHKAKLPGHHDIVVVMRTTSLARGVKYDDLAGDLVSWGLQYIHSLVSLCPGRCSTSSHW